MPAAVQPTVEVWWDQPGPGYLAHLPLLDAVEQTRYHAYRREVDQLNFLAARVIIKKVLAGRSGVPPERIRLISDCPQCGQPHGKPRTDTGEYELSIAHCAGLVVVAVGTTYPLGVDVEPRPGADRFAAIADLAPHILAPTERAHVDGLDEPVRAEYVIRYWTWKEAALKATGDGLGIDPNRVVFSPPGRRPELIEWPGDPAGRAALVLDELALHSDYIAALAVLGTLAAAPIVRRVDSGL
ncbi:MAG: 4'-phosphopantetheinyl transferase family protein [Pseudonocardiaceae bacterium]